MQTDLKDYLVLQEQKKRYLAKVISTSPLKAIVCDEHQKDSDRATYIEFEPGDIVCNLGRKPAYGDAYRVPIEYIRQTFELDPWGSITIYKELTEEQFKKVMRSIKKVTKELEEYRIFPKEKLIHLAVKELKGMEGGHYMRYHNPKKDDRLVIRATEFNEVDYFLRHEIGHGVWFQLCDDSVKARWVKAFTANISLIKDTEKKMALMRKELIKAGTVKSYKKEFDDEDTKNLFNALIKHLSTKYCIDASDINCLIADGEDLTDIWPEEAIHLPKQGILVSEYANKNVKELFSECFAFFLDDKVELPKSMEKLMIKTIEAIRYGKNSPGRKIEDLD